MAEFEPAVEVVLEHEGGVGKLDGDTGGLTAFGWSAPMCQKLGVASPKTADAAKALYLKYFWKPLYDKILSQNVATKVLDDWGLGGYLMWRYPKLDLVMHGYGDTFTTEELRRNEGMETLDPGWDASVRSTGARVAVLRPYARLTYALLNEEGWRLVRQSSTIAVLRAPVGWQSFQSPRAPLSAISAG